MPSQTVIVFRHAERSPAVISRARDLAERLSRTCDRIGRCMIAIESTNSQPFIVHIDLDVPGAHIHADSLASRDNGHDVYLALREAFGDAKRQLIALGHQRRLSKSTMLRRLFISRHESASTTDVAEKSASGGA